jgi:hypothetical protein
MVGVGEGTRAADREGIGRRWPRRWEFRVSACDVPEEGERDGSRGSVVYEHAPLGESG